MISHEHTPTHILKKIKPFIWKKKKLSPLFHYSWSQLFKGENEWMFYLITKLSLLMPMCYLCNLSYHCYCKISELRLT
jgi:hypothetical protein